MLHSCKMFHLTVLETEPPKQKEYILKYLSTPWTHSNLTFPRHTAKKVPPLDAESLTLL